MRQSSNDDAVAIEALAALLEPLLDGGDNAFGGDAAASARPR